MKLLQSLVLLLATLPQPCLAAQAGNADVALRLSKLKPGNTYTVKMERVSVVTSLIVTPADAEVSAAMAGDSIVIETAAGFGLTSGALEIAFQIEPLASGGSITADFPGDAQLEVDGILFLAPDLDKIPIKTLRTYGPLPPTCLAAPTCSPSTRKCTSDTKCYRCGAFCNEPVEWVCCQDDPLP